MSFTFDIFSIKTVPDTYSWDKGTPTLDYNDFVTTLSACRKPSNNNEGVEYVGYAPFVSIALSSSPGNTSSSLLSLKRVVDFGDYYNSESNIVTVPTLSNVLFCHTYIMPGLYTIQIDRKEYIETSVKAFSLYGNCFQKHCIDWSWKNLATCTEELSVTWKSTLPENQYEKKWKFEACVDEGTQNDGLYIQPVDSEERNPLSWQWFNFVCNPVDNPRNTAISWVSSGFQQPEQTTWTESAGPCIQINQTEQITWKWNNITNTKPEDQTTSPITWNQVKSTEPKSATWNHVQQYCTGSYASYVRSYTQTVSKNSYIRVLEIPPTAYLSVTQSADRISPLTVRISPRDTICGSFPIERIVWDLGDGSPLLTQRRWANTLEDPFVFSGAISEDYQDPRNYDIVYTYTKTPSSAFSFYPSITAYASSTNTSDCAAAVVGPLKLASTDGFNFNLMQNELTEHGKILIGQIDNNVVVWRTDK